jgi:hypothetical protein
MISHYKQTPGGIEAAEKVPLMLKRYSHSRKMRRLYLFRENETITRGTVTK